jgi:hypothetical protein
MNCGNSEEFIDAELGDFLVTPIKRLEITIQKESETSSQSEVINLS